MSLYKSGFRAFIFALFCAGMRERDLTVVRKKCEKVYYEVRCRFLSMLILVFTHDWVLDNEPLISHYRGKSWGEKYNKKAFNENTKD